MSNDNDKDQEYQSGRVQIIDSYFKVYNIGLHIQKE